MEESIYIGVKAVQPLENYQLLLTFENSEKGIFDMKPYLEKGIFRQLIDTSLFASVHVSFDTVEWNNGADLCPETLYSQNMKIEQQDLTSQNFDYIEKDHYHGPNNGP